MTTPVRRERLALAGTYAGAATRYWLSVFPQVRSEARYWRVRAEAIPDPLLRALALEAQRIKKANIEGSAAFAAFAPRDRRPAVVRAQVGFQSIYDYVDTLAEQSSAEPISNGRQLHQALLIALQPCASHLDYYAHQERRDDSGYLKEIVTACGAGLSALPSYTSIAPAARNLTEHIVCYQSLNLNKRQGGQQALARWARSATPRGSGLRWWETAASAGSSLGVFALIAAAARPGLAPDEVLAIERAYWPWVGALHSLLDSVADEAEDAAAGQRSLLDYYASPQEAASRMRLLARQAVLWTGRLADPRQHAVLLAGMAGSYLSLPPTSERGQLIAQAVLATMGGLAKPSALIFRTRAAAGRLARGRRRS